MHQGKLGIHHVEVAVGPLTDLGDHAEDQVVVRSTGAPDFLQDQVGGSIAGNVGVPNVQDAVYLFRLDSQGHGGCNQENEGETDHRKRDRDDWPGGYEIALHDFSFASGMRGSQ